MGNKTTIKIKFKNLSDIVFKKISYFIAFFILFFLSISSNVSATSINGFTLETGHANTNQKTIYERWANTGVVSGNNVYEECGWISYVGDIDFIDSIDWDYLYSKNSCKLCGSEVQNGNYRFYRLSGIQGQCTLCTFSGTLVIPVQCYDYYCGEDLKLVAGTATKKYTEILPQLVIDNYEFCWLDIPTRDFKVTNSGETAYILKPICNYDKAIKSVQVNATGVWLSSATPPSATALLVNGTTPTYINKEYDSYNEYEQLYYWYGSLAWEAPVGKKCTEITNITITPSITNGYAYAMVGSINAIYQDNFISISLNPSQIYPNKAGSPASSAVIAKLVDNDGNPLSGYQINFQAEIIESKGHAHTNTRETGVIESWCITDESGQCSVNYNASVVAGKDKITAYLSDYPGIKDSKEIVVRVPGLYSMSGGMYYILVGSPNSNDPCRSAAPTSQHNENHYGTLNLIYAIQQIALQYASQLNDPYINLRINDMSLPWGGLFDINNNWSTPHRGHRIGINADIGFVGWKFISLTDNRCVGLDLETLRKVIRKVTGNYPLSEGNHYHIYVQ